MHVENGINENYLTFSPSVDVPPISCVSGSGPEAALQDSFSDSGEGRVGDGYNFL